MKASFAALPSYLGPLYFPTPQTPLPLTPKLQVSKGNLSLAVLSRRRLLKRQFPWGCGWGERKTETRIVWGLKPSKFYCIRYKVNQLLMSIQAEKGRGLLRVGGGGGGGEEGRGGVCLFLSLATKGGNTFPRDSSQRQEYRPEGRKASGFSSLSDRRSFGHEDLRSGPCLQLVMKRIICLVIKNRTHTNPASNRFPLCLTLP